MSKHTAGPWEIKKSPFAVYNVDHGALTHHIVSGHIMIAALYAHHESHDARLIAAAPELLEFVMEWLDRQGTDNNYMTSKALAAIAKALGEDHE